MISCQIYMSRSNSGLYNCGTSARGWQETAKARTTKGESFFQLLTMSIKKAGNPGFVTSTESSF